MKSMTKKNVQDMSRDELLEEIQNIMYENDAVMFRKDVIIDVALGFELEKLRGQKQSNGKNN